MEKNMMAISQMEILMGRANISIEMEAFIMVHGKKESELAKAPLLQLIIRCSYIII
jgi:hypothetical protein